MKILYIMGYGRSGSTLLDTVLSDHPSVFGAGELCNLIGAMDVHRSYCACGVRSAQCPFWLKVRQDWSRVAGGIVENEYLRLQTRLYRYWLRPRLGDQLMTRYLSQTRALFEAIAETSDGSTIVGSSRAPLRALALSCMGGIEFRVIHLVRDVRGVACSTMKSWEPDPEAGIVAALPAERPTVAAAKWMLTNAIANRIRTLLGDRAILVRYEDFVTNPSITLQRISAFTGLDFEPVAAKLTHGGEFRAKHTIEGNRLRMQARIQLRPDVRWKSELSSVQKRFLPLLASPVAWNYGYRP